MSLTNYVNIVSGNMCTKFHANILTEVLIMAQGYIKDLARHDDDAKGNTIALVMAQR